MSAGHTGGAIQNGAYDDVLVSTLPRRVSKWLRRDLPTRMRRLGCR